jgi:hypothetical protein
MTTSSRHRTAPYRSVTSADRAALIAAVLSVAAVTSQVPGMPVAARGLVLGAFVLLAPGCAVLTRVSIPASARIIVVPCFGIAVIVMCTWASTELIGLSPGLVLAVLAAAVLLVSARPAIAVIAVLRRST